MANTSGHENSCALDPHTCDIFRTLLFSVAKGRHEEGRRFLNLLHDTEGETFIEQESFQIQQQIELEASAETSS
ncbi:hypothetical protein IWW34DRAFT_78207 [Fusarium oxysporum f. sp. albedinis]|nr:hypothetical protein FOMA001_g16157 [Fusarium oxysporum f. sp. matthiolae]KAI3576114.1 hypothetical protein IWW34DRAFT_78207 [Fusarium oxysporum f. sp. albedinis]KAK2472896.1 hypothetical protein H9L39_15071 [Fusarium oxysporum f. sp. albedinis]